jgi:hypothetical protein
MSLRVFPLKKRVANLCSALEMVDVLGRHVNQEIVTARRDEHGQHLRQRGHGLLERALLAGRGTVWVPDFVASAGGVVYTLAREIDGLDHEAATARVEAIEHTVSGLLTSDRTPLEEAVKLAELRLGS